MDQLKLKKKEENKKKSLTSKKLTFFKSNKWNSPFSLKSDLFIRQGFILN
jgi:hypothetical protein